MCFNCWYNSTERRWLRQGKRKTYQKLKSKTPNRPHFDFPNFSLASSESDSSESDFN